MTEQYNIAPHSFIPVVDAAEKLGINANQFIRLLLQAGVKILSHKSLHENSSPNCKYISEQDYDLFVVNIAENVHRGLKSYDMIVAMATKSLSMSLNCAGVYFLVKDDKIQYVGKSQNMLKRIPAHIEDKDFDSVATIKVSNEDDLSMIENAYISYFRPPLNENGFKKLSIYQRLIKQLIKEKDNVYVFGAKV